MTNENDTKALGPMVARAKSILRRNDFTVLFDKGYHTASQMHRCHRLGIDTLVAITDLPSTSHAPHHEYDLKHFRYNPEEDTYTCPQNQTLRTNGTWYKKNRSARAKQYKTKACLDCDFHYVCTRSLTGRVIERTEFTESIERNRQRVEADPELYRKRQQIVEHPYGTIKGQWGFDHVLTKQTMKRASADFGLIMLAYNFRRLLGILGAEGLKKTLKALVRMFFPENARY